MKPQEKEFEYIYRFEENNREEVSSKEGIDVLNAIKYLKDEMKIFFPYESVMNFLSILEELRIEGYGVNFRLESESDYAELKNAIRIASSRKHIRHMKKIKEFPQSSYSLGGRESRKRSILLSLKRGYRTLDIFRESSDTVRYLEERFAKSTIYEALREI